MGTWSKTTRRATGSKVQRVTKQRNLTSNVAINRQLWRKTTENQQLGDHWKTDR